MTGRSLEVEDLVSPSVAGRPRLDRIAVVVAMVGLLVTALLTWGAILANNRNEASLLKLRTRDTAAVLTAAVPSIQTELTDALIVADQGTSPAAFRRFAAKTIGRTTGFVSVSLWQPTGAGAGLVASVGSQPQIIRDGLAMSFFSSMRQGTTLDVTSILAGSTRRVGYADYPTGSRYVVYAESALPANRRLVIPASSPFAQLNYAIYLGRSTRDTDLIEASTATPITAQHSTAQVPLGNSAITVVVTAKTPLTSEMSRLLPWIALAAGLALSLLAVIMVENLSRRRRLAAALNSHLAALYSEQRSIASTLQNALLPERLPPVAGMAIEARYLAGSRGAEVGGDWYEIVVLDDGHFVFVVGDVSGRGIPAAAVMASLRFAARGFALEGHSPANILRQLARTLDFSVDRHFATVLCGSVDVEKHSVTLASAGHLPPVLRDGTRTSVLRIPVSPPVGVESEAPIEEVTLDVPLHALLLAYTDGLVERRGTDLDEALERLQRLLLVQSPSLDELLTNVISELMVDGGEDDIALIGMQWLN